MTRSPLWREFESGESFPVRALRFAVIAGGVLFLGFTGTIGLDWQRQVWVAALILLVALWMNRSSRSYLVTLTLMLLSVYATFRYGFWRYSMTIAYSRGGHANGLDEFFIWLLLLAETYAFAVLFLGYLQMLWPLKRAPAPLPDDTERWPAVDLLIPTLNEPLSVVRFTALAAMNIDWPAEKLNVYLLDDGRREEFRAFAEEAGIGYITRDDNLHAKAGNINHALEQMDSPFVAVFDCDHVPTRSFLQMTMGWFLRDERLGLLQTPHHFYSPDPFERNLDQFRTIPNEGELFYGVVQDGNDFWNATFFCGSCAVLRRAALDEVGGVAVETVTEDAHTSLRLQMRGWNTAYINIPQAAGLATERLSAHVRQRIRWARGMVQILRIENPLLAPGLRPAQRLCYFNAMSHFLYALPRLIFLTAPLIYLIFGATNIPGYWAAIVAYAAPHLVLSNLTNSRIQGQHRHSFWNEIYETVLAPYLFLPTLLALISPKLGTFNVTAKGGVVDKEFFDARIARPTLLLLGFNLFGLLCAVPRFFQFPAFNVPAGLGMWGPLVGQIVNWPASLYDRSHAGTIWVNVLWALFNVTILGVATAVAWESQQRRQTVRVARAVPSEVVLADATVLHGMTSDLSSGGVRTRLGRGLKVAVGDPIKFIFPVLDGLAMLPATIVGIESGREGTLLRAQFDPLNLQQEEALTMILYSRADTWLGWGEAREADRPLRSMGRIVRLSLRGLWHTLRGLTGGGKISPKGSLAASIAPLVLLALLAGGAREARGAQASGTQAIRAAPAAMAGVGRADGGGTFHRGFTLADAGAPETIALRGAEAHYTTYFSVPQNEVVKAGVLRLRYHFSPGLLPNVSQLKVSLNGTPIATLPVTGEPSTTAQGDRTPERESAPGHTLGAVSAGERSALLETAVILPAGLLVHANQLSFEFVGHDTAQCEDPASRALWSHVDGDSKVELSGALLPLPNDLGLLPLPFYDASVDPHPVVPVVFLGEPSPRAMEAAGIVASWFGIQTGFQPVRFPVTVGTIPAGDAIVIAEDPAQIPVALRIAGIDGPTLAMRANPADPYAKVLVLTGNNGDDLVKAAVALATGPGLLKGEQMSVEGVTMPAPRGVDDAPRWLSTEQDKANTFGQAMQTSVLQGDGSAPAAVYLRLPPDLHYGQRQEVALHLRYRYNGAPLAEGSELQVYANGAYAGAAPMPHTDGVTGEQEAVVALPVDELRPFSNTLKMQFAFQVAKKGQCEVAAPLNLQGTVLKDSTLDLAGIAHWTTLPDLELFANAGFPFTRRADLSGTAVVLPDRPTAGELELFLTMMGHFGAETGAPALYVSVTDAAGMTSDSGRDYLVMGTADDQPALRTLGGSLPVEVDAMGMHLQGAAGLLARVEDAWRAGWAALRGSRDQEGLFAMGGGMPDALLEEAEWPAGSGRSVVVVVLREPAVAPRFLTAFLADSQGSEMSQSVSVWRGGRFVSYRLGGTYRVGEVPPLTRLTLVFRDAPWLMVAVATLVCFLMAVLMQASLRRRARSRLAGDY